MVLLVFVNKYSFRYMMDNVLLLNQKSFYFLLDFEPVSESIDLGAT